MLFRGGVFDNVSGVWGSRGGGPTKKQINIPKAARPSPPSHAYTLGPLDLAIKFA